MKIHNNIESLKTSATLAINELSKELIEEGKEVFKFGLGQSPFPIPQVIVDELKKHSHQKDYLNVSGLLALREEVARYHSDKNQYNYDSENVIIGPGSKELIFQVQMALDCDLLLPSPSWVSYEPQAQIINKKIHWINATAESNWHLNPEDLDKVCENLKSVNKLLILNSPNNPSGTIHGNLEDFARIARKHNIIIIADEIYEHLTYDDHEHYSIRSLVPELADSCLIVNGVAKTYAMTGWRVGWMIGPEDAIKAATNLQSHATSNVANVSQQAALAAVSGDLLAVEEMRSAFDRRRQTMTKMLRQIDGVQVIAPQGAFYAYPDLTAFLGKDIGGKVAQSTSELAGIILDQAQVAIVPGEAFGTPGYARLSFALGDDDLVEGINRISQLLSN